MTIFFPSLGLFPLQHAWHGRGQENCGVAIMTLYWAWETKIIIQDTKSLRILADKQ